MKYIFIKLCLSFVLRYSKYLVKRYCSVSITAECDQQSNKRIKIIHILINQIHSLVLSWSGEH